MTWRSARLKQLAAIPITNGLGEAGSYDDRSWPRYIRTTDIKGPRSLREDTFASLPPAVAAQARLRPGDIVMTAAGATIGKSLLYESDDPACYAGYLVRYRASSAADPRYVSYWLESIPFWDQIETGKVVSTIENFSAGKYRNLVLLVPPITDQRAIADFLDAEIARIDDILRLRSRQLELLSQHQASEVDETVSLGSPTAVRRITSFITSGPRGWSDLIADDGDRPFIRSADLQRHSIRLRTTSVTRVRDPHTAESRRTQLKAGDVCIGITGANTGWVGLYDGDLGIASVSQHVALMRPHLVYPLWLAYSASSTAAQQQLMAGQYGGTKQQLGLEDLRQLVIRLPGESEQHSGVARLERSRLFVERVDSVICRQIASLREHRQALITAAVTGEIDVRTASGRGVSA